MNSEDPPAKVKPAPRLRRALTIALPLAACALIGAGVMMERREQPALGRRLTAATAPARPNSATPPALRTAAAVAAPDALRGVPFVSALCSDAGDCACRERAVGRLLAKAAPSAALEALDAAGEACQKRPETQGLRAEALARTGDVNTALPLARRLSLEVPREPHAALALGLLSLERGDPAGTKTAAEQARNLGRGRAAEILLARIAVLANDLQQARRILEKIVASDPEELEAQYWLGVTLRRTGGYQPAREALLAATQGNPRYLEPRLELLQMALAIGALDDARHHYRVLAMLLPPSDPRLLEFGEKLNQGNKRAGSTYTVRPRPSSSGER